MRYVGLTEGNYSFSDSVVLEYRSGMMGGQGNPDRPSIINYQEGSDPDRFPLFVGPYSDIGDQNCPTCGRVLAAGVRSGQLRLIFLRCPCGDGIDFP